jgi:glycosyltransferase involved in cell wall biosynthesis
MAFRGFGQTATTEMVERPAASIVIPLLNQRDTWLRQCVLSALRQTVPADVVVVCSPKTCAANWGTLRALEGQSHRVHTSVQEGHGFAAAINQGFRKAECKRIGLLLSDDWLRPDAVEKCLACDGDIVSTGFTCFAGNGVDEFESLSSDPRCTVYHDLATLEEKAYYLTHFFLFRAAKIVEAAGLDESIGDAPGIDDYDFIWTLLEHGATVSIIEERLYCYRDHKGQRLTLQDPAEQAGNLVRILTKHGIRPEEQEAILRRHSAWFGKPLHRVPTDAQ